MHLTSSLSRWHQALVLTTALALALACAPARAATAPPLGDLLVENRVAPIGIDTTAPRFSWRLKGSANGLRQTAYQIQVSAGAPTSDTQALAWDSGWVETDQSHLVAYAGAVLRSSSDYFWRVRIKDQTHAISVWSPPARWVTGLLDADREFTADWIGLDQPFVGMPDVNSDWFNLGEAKWICHAGTTKAPDGITAYRTQFILPADTKRVMIGMEWNFTGQLFLNGKELFQAGRLPVPSYLNATPWIRSGTNHLTFRVNGVEGGQFGMIAAVRIEGADGTITRHLSDHTWESTRQPVDLWQVPGRAEDGWQAVEVMGKPGEPFRAGQAGEKLETPLFNTSVYLPPSVYLRKEITLSKPVRFAVLHGTAQGLYDLSINGSRLTPSGFQPGWTQFDRRISYVSTDVTAALKPGRNALAVVLADGWFRGNLLWMGREKFGKQIRFSGQLVVEYTDGTRETLSTDPTWKASYGPILQSDILHGEIYDARREMTGWDKPAFDERAWQPVTVTSRANKVEFSATKIDVTEKIRASLKTNQPIVASNGLVGADPCPGTQKALRIIYQVGAEKKQIQIDEPQTWTPPAGLRDTDVQLAIYGDIRSELAFIQRAHQTETVRPQMELPTQTITEPKPGVYVIDLGQNFAGWARLKLSNTTAGQVVYCRFAEDLNADGTIYTDNLRSVNPADRYICKGGRTETWEPRFTYHGFRYVQILGLKVKPGKDAVTGIVAHSSGPITSTFSCSSPMLERLYQNIQWGQRSNYFETMTDCPQRDERLGWVGDAHFFMNSSAYNQQGASFFTKWFLDCLDTQGTNGNIRDGAPGYSPGAGNAHLDWTAAVMVTPWTIWEYYGDTQPILQHYAELKRYMGIWQQFAADINAGPGEPNGGLGNHFVGDWCALQATPNALIGRIFCYALSRQMVAFAQLTGQDDDVRTFTDLAERFRAEVISKHIAADGTVSGDSQTGYALIARYRLFEPAQEALVRERFHQRMVADNYGVMTGFHGTGHLLQGLSAMGLATDASKVILSEAYPGWGCMVKLGATTVWEHWDGKKADGTWHNPTMNSFNHYTFGGCGEWMMGWLVGLRAESPGFKVVRIEPVIVPDLTWAAGSFVSPYGTISNRWERKDGRITMRLVVPPNSTGRVILPLGAKDIQWQKKSLPAFVAGAQAEVTVESGSHEFSWGE